MYDFSKLQQYVEGLVQKGLPGCGIAVYLHGKQVYSHYAGFADEKKTRPVTENDIYYMYSCTKPVTVTAAMQLVEQGKLGLDDPVCRYLPEYADAYYMENGERVTVGETMKVRHLFTMSAGLDYDTESEAIKQVRESTSNAATTRQMVSAFVKKPLLFKPGTRFQYSLCHDALAAVIEVVSGQSFGEYLNEHIFTPLGMTDTGFFPNEEQLERMADQYCSDSNKNMVQYGKWNPYRLSDRYESGGAGLFSNLPAYGRFVAAMSCSGQAADGTRILKPETVDLIRTPQSDDFEEKVSPGGEGYAYGFGVRTLVDKSSGQRSSIGEFGWDGAAGSYLLMDPEKEVAIAYVQHLRDAWVFFDNYHEPLRDLTYEALGL